MKNRTRLCSLAFVCLLSSMAAPSCSDDTSTVKPDSDVENPEGTPDEKPEEKPDDQPEEKPEQKPEDGGGDDQNKPDGEAGLSEELLQKLQSIYDPANIGPQQVTTVHQLAILTSYCASTEVAGPITVTSASLNGKDITLVTLGGTEEKEGQATTMKESQLASFGKPNDYLSAVSKLFADGTVPKGRPVLLTGISLGGMIAQQLLSDSLVAADYELCGIITFGSPINLPLDRRGVKVVRFADANDKVPQLGEIVIRTGMVTPGMSKQELKETLELLDEKEKIVRTSQYTDMIETHALSYIDEPCWNDVDFMGDPGKQNLLELKERLVFYPAPKLSASNK